MISIRSILRLPAIPRNEPTAMISLGNSNAVFARTVKTISPAPMRVSRSLAVKNRLRAALQRYKKPDLLKAQLMPLSMQEMDNSILVTLGELGHYRARIEIMKRHIMCQDRANYEQACEKYKIISKKNRENMYLLSLPYHIGMGVAVAAGLIALPMVFHLPTAEWFNTHYVTTDVPVPADLETLLEVGSWTWNWM